MNKILTGGIESFGRFYGTYIGFVHSIEKGQKLYVSIPEVLGNKKDLLLARPKVYGGDGYGIQNLPEIGDAVWISFRFGHHEHPLWEHGYYTEQELPEDYQDTNVKGIITPDGIRILLNGSVITAYNKETYGITINDGGVVLGKESEDKEPAVLGDTLASLLDEMIDLVEAMVFATPAGNTTGLLTTPQWEQFRLKIDTLKAKSVTLD